MNRLNSLFTLSSLSVVLVSVERYSFTTKILLQPYSFMRLHEIVQMVFIILLTVLIPVFILKEITNDFSLLKNKSVFWLFILFFVGVYFYATGNGIHEVSSFNFNHFCDVDNFSDNLCGGFFINDYYTGNIFYFVGAALMVIPTLLIEKMNPKYVLGKKDMTILVVNSLVYALAIFAYAAFDRVLVGLIYSLVITGVALILFSAIRKNYKKYPLITYTTLTYTIGTLAAFLFRTVN